MDKRSIIEQLADFAVGIRCAALPELVLKKTKICILDALECCLAGNNGDPRSEAAWAYVRERTGPSTALARGIGLTPADAAFYNAVTGAVSSRNDISKPGSCHAGSVVVPVALALAEALGSSGSEVVEAVLAGYETMIRLGIALRTAPVPKAFRSTAILAPFGAAFTAARLLKLNAEQTANAASFACHSASGFNNWVSEGTGEDALQNAWGARNGLEAALLAQTGLRAAKRALEDPNGLLAAFSALEQADGITVALGKKWHILDVDFKPMGSCLKLMAPCQGARQLLAQIGSLEDIESIRIGVSNVTLHHAGTCETEVTSQVQAIMSIPFGVANVLVFGDYSGINWYPPYDPAVCAMMKRCTVLEDAALTAVFPAKRGARVTVRMRDGQTHEAYLEDAIGLKPDDIEALFIRTAGVHCRHADAPHLARRILVLERLDNVEVLCKELA